MPFSASRAADVRTAARRTAAVRRSVVILAMPALVLANCGTDRPAARVVAPPVPTPSPTATHQGYYVTPGGSPAGDGSAANPWDLQTALAQPRVVQPGDTIWLRGGTYQGNFRGVVSGTLADPIVVRQYPGERATIDGRLDVGGRNASYWGFEVTDSDPQRVSAQVGSAPTDLPRQLVTVFVSGTNVKLINLVIHDLGNGVFSGVGAEDVEIYGNLVYNNGWLSPDRGSGHNLYLQNTTPTKRVLDNVVFHSFAFGLHLYGSDAAAVQNFDVEGNTIFESGAPAAARFATSANILQEGGAPGTLGRSVFSANSIYHRGTDQTLRFNGDTDDPGADITFSNNVVQGLATFNRMSRYTVTGNKFSSGPNQLTGQSALVGLRVGPGDAHVWTNNQYAAPDGGQAPFYVVRSGADGVGYSYSAWRTATGYDAGSTFRSGQFATPDVIVRPNRYEPGRAFVTVWNWPGAAAVPVDLSGVLKPGDRFQIHHVYDVFGAPVLTGTYTGAPVTIPQTRVTPPAPIGYAAPLAPSDVHFNVFLVRPL